MNSDPRYSFTIEDSDEFNTEIPVFRLDKDLYDSIGKNKDGLHHFHKIDRNIEQFDNLRLYRNNNRKYHKLCLLLLSCIIVYYILKK